MSTTSSPIYSLLPAIFRTRDAAQGGQLQALFAVLESQYCLVKDNVQQLYDDQFIETCAPWVIPYIGQLIGFNPVYTAALASPDSRAEVANTIGYRRRKGTLIALEQITHDVSGRTTMAVEEFRYLVTTLSLRDVRPTSYATADLRDSSVLQDQNGPFNQLNRTIDVRNITPRSRTPLLPDAAPLEIALHGPGRFNIHEVAVWMWRWQSTPVVNAPAFALDNGGYYFSSLGNPVPLFQTVPEEPAPFSWLVTETDVPEPISYQNFNAQLANLFILFAASQSPYAIATSQEFEVMLRDQYGMPASGVSITFTVTGANNTTGAVTTNSTGVASYSYVGTSIGNDTIQATFTLNGVTTASNSLFVSWAAAVSPAQAGGGSTAALINSAASAIYPGSFELIADGQPVPVSQIICANLSELPDGLVCTVPKGMIAIDPELGRIQYASDLVLPQDLRVNYNYGAPAPMGGGSYDRTENVVQPGTVADIEYVNSGDLFVAQVGTAAYPTLESAVQAWNLLPANSAGTILLPNFESYSIDLTGANAIQIPAESLLLITSAEISTGGDAPEWKNSCVTLNGNIEVYAPPLALGPDGLALPAGQVQISSVWLSGQLILSGDEACVQLADCTLVPGISLDSKGDPAHPGEPSVTGSALTMTLCLNRAVSGPIALPYTCSTRICSSIVDAGSPYCPAFAGNEPASPGATLHIEDSTLIGRVWAQAIRLASNTIFYSRLGNYDPWPAPVWAQRVQVGCMRFCWLPANSMTPRQYQCLQPDSSSAPTLEPAFVSLRFGNPAYCLLSGDVPMAIWRGADNGSQMGVFYQIQETEAVANIQVRSAEYLPANLAGGVFLIPSRPLIVPLPQMEYGYGIRKRQCGCSTVGEDDETPIGIGIGLI